MIPPSGRTAKPMPSVAKDSSVPDSGSSAGKKALLKYRAAAVPKPMKSYVSIVAPIEQPIATFFFVGVPSMGCHCGDLLERGAVVGNVPFGHE